MELSIRYLVTAAILIIALIVISFFITTGTSPSISQSSANFFFSSKCQEYASRGCDWTVTYDSDFPKYLDACRQIFGPANTEKTDNGASCLYIHCSSCNKIEASQRTCAGIAKSCAALQQDSNDGLTTARCCEDYRIKCPNEPDLASGIC